ncbi:extracellular solute-binding protein [Candidatus Phytoplasma australasiaticum]
MVLKVNLKSKILNIGNVSKIFIYFGTIIVFIIISNSLRTSQDNEFFIKKYDNLRNLVSKKFQNHNSQINYFKHLKKPVEIIFWHTLYPRELEIVKETIREFEKHNPNIKVKDVNKVNWEQICKSVANSLPVNKQPNIAFSYDDHIEFYSKSFKVVPLDIFMDYDEDFGKTSESNNKYNFFPGYAKKLKLPNVYDGQDHHYSLPFVKSTEVMFYDSDLFKQYRDDLNKVFYEKHKSDFKDSCQEIIDSNVVDCGNTNVISDFRYKIAKKIIRIDHHLIGDVYGDEKNSWIEPNFSSCSEMIYTFKEINNLKLSIKGALPIYIGMVTDTGHFRFDRVNHKTLKIVSDLLSYGFDAFQIDTKITVQPINILRFKGYVCSNFVAEDGLIYVKITNEIIEKFKLRFEDINSVVNIFHNIQDHPVWLFIIENKVNNYWKISIRSIGPKINHIANKFNGGGHFRACGMNVYNQQEIDQVIQLAKNSIKDYEHQRNLNIKLSNQ